MSIKIGTKIEKLNPTDTYKLMDWEDINDTANIGNSVNDLKNSQAILENNINQKLSGITLSDKHGNSLVDITGLEIVGGTVSDDDSDAVATITVAPEITVANGQEPGSTSLKGNALVFEGATVEADPDDTSVVKITMPAMGTKGINLGDGVNASRDVETVILRGHQAYGSGNTAEIHLEFAHFKTLAERDTWSAKFGAGMTYDTISVVDADENGYVQWYKFSASTKAWTEYDAQGLVMSDSNGAIPKNIKTVVFGPGFDIQQAGDQEDAALVTYAGSGGGGGSPLTVSQDWGTGAESQNVDAIQTLYPLEVNQNQIGDTPLQGNATLSIDPTAYETQHGHACLIKLDMIQTIAGQHPHAVYMTEEVVPTGEYFNLNPQGRGIDVSDTTGGDTAVTGGQMTEVLAKLAFVDNAPDDGTLTVWVEYKDPSDALAKKILADVNGNPLAVSKHFKAGDAIGDFIIAGAFMAKATQPLKVVVETSFHVDSEITLDPVNTMVCLNQFSNGYETSIARIEFLRRAATQITPAIQKFTSKMLSLSKEIKGLTQVNTVIAAGTGTDTLNEFGVQNLTTIMVSAENDVMTIKDANVIADFYVDTLIDNTHTRMLRGKEVTCGITVANPDGAFEYEAYKWTGKPDQITQVYSKRNDDGSGVIVINDGWAAVKGIFISEQPNGNEYGHVLTFTVPDDANNIIVLVRPQEPQSPLTLKLSEFDWGTTKDFTGYVEIERYNSHEDHLRFDDTYAEYFLTNEGYASLRYTINNTPSTGNPMPVGKLTKGKAPVELDTTVNQVSGSAVPQYEGAIKFKAAGEASISKSYNVWNEQNTDDTVTFWDVLIDVDGNETKIDDSERTFTVAKNTGAPGVIYTIPAYAIDVEVGQRIGGRASSTKADGVYVQSQNISEYLVQTVVELKELVAEGYDDPELITSPITRKLVVDNRVHPFTGNQAQNVIITGLDIPADVRLANVTAQKTLADGFTSIETVQHAYNENTKELTVHVGPVTSGIIFLEFWG